MEYDLQTSCYGCDLVRVMIEKQNMTQAFDPKARVIFLAEKKTDSSTI